MDYQDEATITFRSLATSFYISSYKTFSDVCILHALWLISWSSFIWAHLCGKITKHLFKWNNLKSMFNFRCELTKYTHKNAECNKYMIWCKDGPNEYHYWWQYNVEWGFRYTSRKCTVDIYKKPAKVFMLSKVVKYVTINIYSDSSLTHTFSECNDTRPSFSGHMEMVLSALRMKLLTWRNWCW